MVARECCELIAATAASCVAVKPQLACFERLGAAGWEALEEVVQAAGEAGLLVVADGKRGDVPHTAAVYAEAILGTLGADAATVNPLLGGDALEPWVAAAERGGGGLFALVRTSNPGAADVLDLPVGGQNNNAAGGRPLHERLAAMVAERAPRLAGESGLSGMGAVVGATEPRHFAALRTLMPDSILLVPGIGAQGGDAAALGPAFSGDPASVLVPASRSIAGAADPATAAAELREQVWAVSQSATR